MYVIAAFAMALVVGCRQEQENVEPDAVPHPDDALVQVFPATKAAELFTAAWPPAAELQLEACEMESAGLWRFTGSMLGVDVGQVLGLDLIVSQDGMVAVYRSAARVNEIGRFRLVLYAIEIGGSGSMTLAIPANACRIDVRGEYGRIGSSNTLSATEAGSPVLTRSRT